MDADGQNPLRLTDSGGAGQPTWSPDGRRIAFASNRDGNMEIYAIDADGQNLQCLTENSDHDWFPAWSPIGDRILFESDRDGD